MDKVKWTNPEGSVVVVKLGHDVKISYGVTIGSDVKLGYGVADARLIEHAPRMRELLAEVANWEAYMGGFDGVIWSEIRTLLDGLRDANEAIAAARKEG